MQVSENALFHRRCPLFVFSIIIQSLPDEFRKAPKIEGQLLSFAWIPDLQLTTNDQMKIEIPN